MQRVILIVIVVMCMISLATAQNERGLIMVRCEDGAGNYLASPSDINLDELRGQFNPALDTVFFIHGFNTTPSGAADSYNSLIALLQQQGVSANFVGVYWPSDTGLLNFGKAIENANLSGPYVVHILAEMTRWYGNSNRSINIVIHSLGARVLLRTLQENDARYVKFGHCFLCAAAVHTNAYLNGFLGTNLLPKSSQVYYSNRDGILKYIYALYYWLFERRAEPTSDPMYEKWQSLTVDEQIAYMASLDAKAQAGNLPRSEFDEALYSTIRESEKSAMGLVGAMLGEPPSVEKVFNLDMVEAIGGHSEYWKSSVIAQKIAALLR